MAIVYRHRRLDTCEIFYIGLGVIKNRAYQIRSRNDLWHNVVNKTKYRVEIIAEKLSYENAIELEKFLIEEYGRRDIGTGILVNMTDGGDGQLNMSDHTREKISNTLKGISQSEYTKNKRKESVKKAWSCEKLKQSQRDRTLLLWEEGRIKGMTGIPSKKKGVSFSGDAEKLSKSLKEYYKTAKPHNYKIIHDEVKKCIIEDFIAGICKFKLHKKYYLNRKIIDRIIKEYES